MNTLALKQAIENGLQNPARDVVGQCASPAANGSLGALCGLQPIGADMGQAPAAPQQPDGPVGGGLAM